MKRVHRRRPRAITLVSFSLRFLFLDDGTVQLRLATRVQRTIVGTASGRRRAKG